MTVLVTGCAGFIGSHLTEALLAGGHSVVGVDSLTDYYDPRLKRHNLTKFERDPEFSYREQDVMSLTSEALSSVEVIFHLAAQPGVRQSWGSSFRAYAYHNVIATEHLLEVAISLPRLRRFVYASSSSVYGNVRVERTPEDHPVAPESPYGITKLGGELLCRAYASSFRLPAVSLRFFTVYGPRQRPDMAFNRLIRCAMSGEPFEIYGAGTQERDFTYVGDIVRALNLAGFGEVAQGVFNIGGGRVASLNEVISIVGRILGSSVVTLKRPHPHGDVQRTCADTSHAKHLLGYAPRTSLEDGIAAQVAAASPEPALVAAAG
jgi:nucleoside-diphosphate-sugar epimerase